MTNPKRKHRLVALGGTFDHFHAGHEHFLEFAARQGEELIIGLTSDDLIAGKPFASSLESYPARAASVRRFCQRRQIKAKLIPLTDVYGPTLEDRKIGALVVTEETQAGAEKINETRAALKMRPLPVYLAEFIKDESGAPLHSVSIRAGLVDRRGRVYSRHFKKDLKLTEAQREALSAPLGTIVVDLSSFKPKAKAVLIGDDTTTQFLDQGRSFDFAIIDGLIKRQATHNQALLDQFAGKMVTATNQAGYLSAELMEALKERQPTTKLIFVNGEEDLATAGAILLLPLGSTIYYGQPDAGLVEVSVTEALKEKIFAILKPDETTG